MSEKLDTSYEQQKSDLEKRQHLVQLLEEVRDFASKSGLEGELEVYLNDKFIPSMREPDNL